MKAANVILANATVTNLLLGGPLKAPTYRTFYQGPQFQAGLSPRVVGGISLPVFGAERRGEPNLKNRGLMLSTTSCLLEFKSRLASTKKGGAFPWSWGQTHPAIAWTIRGLDSTVIAQQRATSFQQVHPIALQSLSPLATPRVCTLTACPGCADRQD